FLKSVSSIDECNGKGDMKATPRGEGLSRLSVPREAVAKLTNQLTKRNPLLTRVLQNSEFANCRSACIRLIEFQASDIPLLASLQGGVAARIRKCREASTDSADGVVFRLRTKKENHPGCVCVGGFAKFSLMTRPPPLLAAMQGGEYRSPATR